MELILSILFLFIMFSFLGWVLEVSFRSFVAKRLANPGFMTGVTLPIYGVGGLVLVFISNYIDSLNGNYRYLLLFLICFILMSTIEFLGGYISLKFYNTKLWDYSDNFLNYKGIICLKYSIVWGVFGVLFYLFLYNNIYTVLDIFLANKYYIFLFGIVFGIFLVDLFYSLNLLIVIKKYNNLIRETISVEKLKLYMFLENKKISFFTNFKLMKFIKDKLGK